MLTLITYISDLFTLKDICKLNLYYLWETPSKNVSDLRFQLIITHYFIPIDVSSKHMGYECCFFIDYFARGTSMYC